MEAEGSPLGHPLCKTCRDDPSDQLSPCGHKVCELHAIGLKDDSVICGHCGVIVSEIFALKGPAATVSPLQLPESLFKITPQKDSPLRKMLSNDDDGSSTSFGLGSGIGSGMDGSNRFSMLAREDSVPSTPTPHSRNRDDNSGSTIKPIGVYRPPQLRNDLIPRPESALSTASFATQVPPEHSSFLSPHGSDISSQASTPNGPYRLGGGQLAQHMSRLNLFEHQQRGPRPRNPFSTFDHQQRGPPPRNPFSTFDRTIRPPQQMNSQPQQMNDPPQQTDSPQLQSNRNSPEFGPGSELLPLPQPGDDHATRAAKLAAIVKGGWTDDPRDPDFGNPGPSKRVPPMAGKSPVPKPKRGDVVAGAGQSTPSPARRGTKEVPNIDGNAAAFINVKDLKHPAWFNNLARGYIPTFEQFMAVIPLVEACSMARPSTAGVIHITNMPYSTSRSEITALLGHQAKIVPQPPGTGFLAVHITMERQSGKTLDAFVEVETVREAQMLVNQFGGRAARGRPPKLSDRAVAINLSNRDAMMAAIFPSGKNVTWIDGVPQISNKIEYYYPDQPSTGFQGFLQDEEIYHMSKHAETPQRSPFAQRCPIRTFECLITTLHKYPWFATEYTLESERARLYDCTKTTIRALVNLLSKTHGNHRAELSKPTTNTLKELAVAALTCPGFGEREKAQIIADLKSSGYHQLTKPHGMNVRFGGNHAWAADWPFKVAAKHPGVSDQMMEAFATLMRDATRGVGASMNDIPAAHRGMVSDNFGVVNINYDGCKTLADYARAEIHAIEGYVTRVLPRTGPTPGSRNSSINS